MRFETALTKPHLKCTGLQMIIRIGGNGDGDEYRGRFDYHSLSFSSLHEANDYMAKR